MNFFTGHGQIWTRIQDPTCLVKKFTGHKPDPSGIWCGREKKKKEGEKSEVRTGAVLNSCVSETKQKRGEKYKEQEKIVRDIQ